MIKVIVLLVVLFSATPVLAEDKNPYDLRMENLEAAKAGNLEAQFQVGESFCCGGDEYHDVQKATWWYCDAARDKHAPSQFQVGEIYRTDRTIEISEGALKAHPQLNDDVLSYVWFKIADQNGYEKAKPQWQKIKDRLSRAQLQEAESMIPFFPYVPCEIEVGADETQNADAQPQEETLSDSDAAPAAGGN